MAIPQWDDSRPSPPPPISYQSAIVPPPAMFTTESIEGHEIVAYLGFVHGSCSLSSTCFLLTSVEAAHVRAVQVATERLFEMACRRQANAIVGVRMNDGPRVTFYGTAVLTRPING